MLIIPPTGVNLTTLNSKFQLWALVWHLGPSFNVVKLVRLSTALLSEYRLFQTPSLALEMRQTIKFKSGL
jgi:hypothetical protein